MGLIKSLVSVSEKVRICGPSQRLSFEFVTRTFLNGEFPTVYFGATKYFDGRYFPFYDNEDLTLTQTINTPGLVPDSVYELRFTDRKTAAVGALLVKNYNGFDYETFNKHCYSPYVISRITLDTNRQSVFNVFRDIKIVQGNMSVINKNTYNVLQYDTPQFNRAPTSNNQENLVLDTDILIDSSNGIGIKMFWDVINNVDYQSPRVTFDISPAKYT